MQGGGPCLFGDDARRTIADLWNRHVPVLELRGAIPVGVAAGLPPALACGAAILGNMVPVPFIMLLIRRILTGCGRQPCLDRRSNG